MLHLPPNWQRNLLPRRGYPSAAALERAKPNADKAWKAIRKNWSARAKHPWRFAAEPALAEAAQSMLDEEAPPEVSDIRVQAVVARMLGYGDKSITAPIIDYWVAASGVSFAVKAAFETLETRYGAKYELYPKTESDKAPSWYQQTPTVFPQLRRLLCQADDATYFEARDLAAAFRGPGSDVVRAVAAFLFPTETDWVEESVAELTGKELEAESMLVLASLTKATQLELLDRGPSAVIQGRWGKRRTELLPSLMEGLGGDLAKPIIAWLAHPHIDSEQKKSLYEALSMLPGDAALAGLLDQLGEKYVLPAAVEAVQRFPERATRLLTERLAGRKSGADEVKRLLGTVLSKRPEAVEAVRRDLDEGQRAAIADLEASRVTVPSAAPAELPTLLVSPPWTSKKKREKPLVVKDVVPLDPAPRMSWAPGEREKWAATHKPAGYAVNVSAEDWQEMVTQLRAGNLPMWRREMLLIGAPDRIAREVVKYWLPTSPWHVSSYLHAAVARFELEAIDGIRYYLENYLREALAYLAPFDVPAFAPFVADAFARLKSARSDARAWMDRYPETTATGVIPDAVGKSGKARRAGEAALRYLKAQGHEDKVLAAAARYGEAVSAAVARIVSLDPEDVLPAKMPKMPKFWDVDTLPALLLVGGKRSLPSSAVEHLGTMLAISKAGEEYAGLDEVAQTCDADSLERFAWELFEAWQAAGTPSKESWAFSALGLFGGDDVARRLAPLIRKWPGDGGHARAVIGLEVLASIGTDVALMHLHGIAQKVKFKGLQKNAKQMIEVIARDRNLTPEELADRLVPDLGLDENGSLMLDYGPRQFTVGFDEYLKPFVLEGGKPRKSLPKPGVKDDTEKAPAAYKRFSALKKDARTAAKAQILRLELAMVGRRRWTGAQLGQFFIEHPLMIHLSRRLVWARYDGSSVVETFRVAEDGTLASAADDEKTLADDALVGIVHALDLSADDAKTWGGVFSDYELLQPFTQLGRETYAIEESEKTTKVLDRFKGQKVPTRSVIGLESQGWRRGPPEDAGVVGWMEKMLPGGASACLHLDPGLFTGYLDDAPEQTLDSVTVTRGTNNWDSQGVTEFGELAPVVFSELVRDITLLTNG
ncbi:MAG: molybdate metabolism regulator [Deltaproteobacteria bacterium]|nr:MAG: molybdate metabolism regulator [Deltaproteobacteria bacterium]